MGQYRVPMSDLPDPKKKLRTEALARRTALDEAARAAAAAMVAARPFPEPVSIGAVVAGYAPVRGEFDPRPLMRALAAQGAQLALPVIAGRGQPLSFRHWQEGAPLLSGPYGIPQPSDDAALLVPDIVLVPLAAFDRALHRVGYGGGFYDRTLAALRAARPVIAAGLAFAVQEVASVPAGAHDVALDFVLTERETIRAGGR